MPNFPHMKESAFPHLNNVDVYKYKNEFDYSRYDDAQMRITLCSVPWDMGEAHIGARTITGIGNVVYFETEKKRNAWFDAIPDSKCLRFTTKYKELHRDNQIILPVPFDAACLYNYLVVEYEPFANADILVEYETRNGLDRWFWFVREVEFVAPNSTRIHLMNDAWQTFIYRMHFAGMILERGHAPLFATNADTYLANPIENNEMLLAEDVNYGTEPARVKSSQAHVFNSDNWACVACTSSPTSSWGTKAAGTWNTPALSSYTVDGVPNMRIFAMEVSALNTFLGTVDADAPQFKQTVKGVFFAPKELVTTGTSFVFCGTTCYWISTSNKTIEFLTLNKNQFGYPSEYRNLAKLYTWPYACIEITDENGNVNKLHIEDTDGKLDISASLSLAYPAINLQAHLLGYGSSGSSALTFTNITSRSLAIGGTWYQTLHSWNIPVFGIVQSNATHYDFDTYFDRAQQVTAYTNEYNSSVASANTAQANAYASADTLKANADNSAGTVVDNAALQATCNSTHTSAGNTQASSDTQTNQSLNTALTGNGIDFTNASTNNSIDMQYASGMASMASNAVNTAGSALASVASGNIPGALAAAFGGIANGAAIGVQTQAGINYTGAQAQANNQQNHRNAIDGNIANYDLSQHSITAANTKVAATNAMTTGAAANNAATMMTNAANEQATIKANADRSLATDTANAGRTRDTAQSAIANGIKQAALRAPLEFGDFANNSQATTKPLALIANVVTQSANAIRQTGDDFLRYGYYYNMQWPFNGNWNIGKHYTYWKLADFWVKGLNIPDMYVDKLRFFLYGGVTIWRKPEDIGNVTIYQNV